MKFNKKGQGALEYLLLIGGAVLIAVIVIALLVGMGSSSRSNTEATADKLTSQDTVIPPYITNIVCSTTTVANDSYTVALSEGDTITYSYVLYVNGIEIGAMDTNPDTIDGTGILTCAAGQRAFVTKTQIASPNGSASSVGITING